MERCDVLIVGQGLAGTWLGYWLEKNGLSYQVIDRGPAASASAIASGLINPVTGRRWVKTWMIDQLMPFAWESYAALGALLGGQLIHETTVVDFFPTVQMLQAFQSGLTENPQYLLAGEDREKFAPWFRYELGWGSIRPVYLVQAAMLLRRWRERLTAQNRLVEETFEPAMLLENKTGLVYKDIEAGQIIFCDGAAAASGKWFGKLPFSLNKGEALILETDALPPGYVFKKGLSLLPWTDGLWWAGSSYTWSDTDDRPTPGFRKQAESQLGGWLKGGYRIVDHLAAWRPATLERRPFAGFHPLHPRIGLLNGLGTKGCSLAPWFAAQLADKIKNGRNIDRLADIGRFSRILSL